jgi:hypothetical protein
VIGALMRSVCFKRVVVQTDSNVASGIIDVVVVVNNILRR